MSNFVSVSAHSLANFDLEKYVPFGTRLASPKIKAIYSFHQIFRARVHSGLTVCAADRWENYNFLSGMTLVTLIWRQIRDDLRGTEKDHPSQRTTSTQKSQLFSLRRWALQFLISFKNQILPWTNTLNLQLRVNWLIQSVPCMMMSVVFPTVLKFWKMLKSEVWT